ncbi:hypothetical protein HED63_04225 [Ochrobactrum cytisi]|nr:hypothetical protein [Brucella cytisi]
MRGSGFLHGEMGVAHHLRGMWWNMRTVPGAAAAMPGDRIRAGGRGIREV